jgi:hypothetical protein
MRSAYTIDDVQSLAPTIENWMLLEEQLQYISDLSNWHRDEEDKIRRKQRRFSEKNWGSERYAVLVHSARHHVCEYADLSSDYIVFSAKRKEIEAILEEQGLIE